MPQHVRRHARRIEPRLQRHLLQQQEEALPRQRPARVAAREQPAPRPCRSRRPARRRPASPPRTAARCAPCRPCRGSAAPPRRPPARGAAAPAARTPASRWRTGFPAPPARVAPARPARVPAAASSASTSCSLRYFGSDRGRRGASSSEVGSSARTPSRSRNRWNWRSADSRRAAVRADSPAVPGRPYRPAASPHPRRAAACPRAAAKAAKSARSACVRRQRVARRAALGGQHLQERLDVAVHVQWLWNLSFGSTFSTACCAGLGGNAPRYTTAPPSDHQRRARATIRNMRIMDAATGSCVRLRQRPSWPACAAGVLALRRHDTQHRPEGSACRCPTRWPGAASCWSG